MMPTFVGEIYICKILVSDSLLCEDSFR